jgi:hypothetical protein
LEPVFFAKNWKHPGGNKISNRGDFNLSEATHYKSIEDQTATKENTSDKKEHKTSE